MKQIISSILICSLFSAHVVMAEVTDPSCRKGGLRCIQKASGVEMSLEFECKDKMKNVLKGEKKIEPKCEEYAKKREEEKKKEVQICNQIRSDWKCDALSATLPQDERSRLIVVD